MTRARLAPLLALAASLVVASPAAAANRRVEAAAKDALKRAANDYLATDYATAAARLDKAARACGANKCTPQTKAAVLRDLGTMQFRNGDVGTSKKTWAEAVKLDAALTLNPDYDAPDLRAAWEDVKGGADAGGGGAQPTGDFAHTPAPEQKVDTPLPVYVEYPGSSAIVRVVLKYKGASMTDWKRMDLKKMGSGWGGTVPCADVTSGVMRYWIQGFDDGGDPIAGSGDPKHPYTVPIREDIAGDAPHLPGKSAPKSCTEDSDCPPGLPGCDKEEDNTPDTEAETEKAQEEPGKGYARVWVGIAGSLDLLQLPAGDDLCKLSNTAAPLNSANYYCTNPDGTDFPSRANPIQNNHLSVRGQAGHLDGGLQPGDVRVMLLFDYALTANFLAGGRLGYVLNGYTGNAAVKDGRSFGPKVHLEARATYVLGHEPLGHAGFAPMGFVGLGVSEFDGHSTSVVTLDNVAGQQPVNIWLTDGPFFLTFGLGARYQFSPRAAFTAAARLNAAMGGNGFLPTYGPEIGIQYGF
jgi:hypothetical protein